MTTSTFVERRRLLARRALLSLTTVLCSGLAAPAFAHAQTEFQNVDANGVDVVTGGFNYSILLGSIGSGASSLSMVHGASDFANGIPGPLFYSGFTPNKIGLSFGTDAENFTLQGGAWVSREGSGATITGDATGYTYLGADGTRITYGRPDGILHAGQNTSGFAFCGGAETQSCRLLPLSKTLPDGRAQRYYWAVASVCDTEINPETGEVACTHFVRLSSIVNESGYLLKIKYAQDSHGAAGPSPDWFKRVSVKFVNQMKEYCDPNAVNCDALVQSWPTATLSYPLSTVTQITDSAGGAWRLTAGASTFAIKRPGSNSNTTSVTSSNGIVTSITTNGVASTYSRSVSAGVVTTVRTTASRQATFRTRSAEGRPYQVTNEAGETTAYTYDASSRPTEIASPDGIKRQLVYDARGNVTQTTVKAKPNSGLANIVTTASYDATCANPIKCNQPNWTRDDKQNQTDYNYDPGSGLLTSVVAPEPTPGAPRPTTTFGYGAVAGYGGESVNVLTTVAACRTTATCAGTANEVRVTTGFGGVAANNLQPVSVTRGAGDSSLVATTTSAYDKVGNVVSVDGPLAGNADTTTYRYDVGRRMVGAISPDPDGGGPLKRRAARMTYNADGQVTVTEAGTVAGATDADWTGFVSLQQATATYDANGRKTRNVTTAGGATYGVAQYSYDVLGRLDCAALRMNPAAWGSLPSSACTLGTVGGAGPDRISKTSYDAVGRPLKVQLAYATADQADEATTTYMPGGLPETLRDTQGNLTTYEYDGFNRLTRTLYPSPTAGAGVSSTTDFEQLSYDSNVNVISRRLRDGNTIKYTYDVLGRLILLDTANLTTDDQDVVFTYDNLGQLLRAAKNPTNQTAFSYDALGRKLTESNYYYSLTFRYDAAGRRTRMTWGDGFYLTYNHLVTGEMTAIRENGAASGIGVLATFGYDDLGRRTTLTRGNGTVTSYGHDPISRLSSLTHDLAGTNRDLLSTFAYNVAGQLSQVTRSNDAYSWTGHVNADRSYAINGLNQISAATGLAPTHDARGNLTGTGGLSYLYTSGNRLAGASNGSLLYADSLERLDYISAEGVLLAHDGARMTSEHNLQAAGYPVARRYVHGPGVDEPLIWYEGSGTADRRWLHADERGSVIAVTNAAGTATATNSYDEYGVPGAGNSGRFQYTGQAWVPSVGLYDYKARMYSPSLGRFMQTDPIGYAGGMNLYGYVGGDPVNMVDPSGLEPCPDPDGPDQIVVCGEREKPKPAPKLSPEPGGEFYFPVYESQPQNPFGEPEQTTVVAPPRDEQAKCGSGSFFAGTESNGSPICAPLKPQPKYNPKVNYCGGGSGPRAPNRVGGANINSACFTHDICYTSSGFSQATCDSRFRREIDRRCRAAGSGPLFCGVASYTYFGVVEDLGVLFYER